MKSRYDCGKPILLFGKKLLNHGCYERDGVSLHFMRLVFFPVEGMAWRMANEKMYSVTLAFLERV